MRTNHESQRPDPAFGRRERIRRASDIGHRHCTCICTCGAERYCAILDCDKPAEPGRRYCIWHPTLKLAVSSS